MDVALFFLVLALFAGWPGVAFVHYRFHRGYPVARSLFLMVAPGMGAVLVVLLASDGVLLPRHLGALAGGLLASFHLLWIAAPYFILARWAWRAVRQRRRSAAVEAAG